MRYDLTVYWVEDTPTWSQSAKSLLMGHLENDGVTVNFVIEANAEKAKRELENSSKGFKKYDLIFVDYNIATVLPGAETATQISGKDIIELFRDCDVDVDILFYSAAHEREVRSAVTENLSAFEGVYIANRNNFQEKALALIMKNVRRLLSIKNIRGTLMDSTSENDFIINSYIAEKYPLLEEEDKKEVSKLIAEKLMEKVHPTAEEIKTVCESLHASNFIDNINKFIRHPSYILPLEIRYALFIEIAVRNGQSRTRIESYFNTVVKNRNRLAHKKIDICENSDHIKYCDTLTQLLARTCPEDCAQCPGFSISLDQWKQIRKQTSAFSYIFSSMLDTLIADDTQSE